MTIASPSEWRTTHRSAKSLLLTVFGEFVLPSGGSVWTSTLVQCGAALNVSEKNARQATARIADDGLIDSARHGRAVRWSLTEAGRRLLESGAERIYGLGVDADGWDGRWLVVHCPAGVPPLRRDRFRSRMAFVGAGELSPTLFVTPHVDREPLIREILADFGRDGESIVFAASLSDADECAGMVESAWDLEALGVDYERFVVWADRLAVSSPSDAFRSTVELVHAWRRFPFVDPELPAELLPQTWPGHRAAQRFRESRAAWRPDARGWFDGVDAARRSA